MPALDRADFAAFFQAVRGFPPFAWQERLLGHVIDHGRWPDQISAPTGAGKTSVIDVHVFANALFAVGAGPRVPRRLALVVNRRLLVDSHAEHARYLAKVLRDSHDELVLRVAEALRSRVPPPLAGSAAGEITAVVPLLTAVLRGGAPTDDDWRIQPEVCAVLTCTPAMWGSRLLFRGYGTSRRARPQEAGLLALDSVVVVDEAHLSRQLLRTARRVAELCGRDGLPGAVPALQVSETTATPASASGVTVGVEPRDLTMSPVLERRLTRPKPVTVRAVPEWPAPATGAARGVVTSAVVDAVVDVLDQTAKTSRDAERPHTVGCVLNRVSDALAVTEKLRERGLCVVALTGRLRPVDREAIKRRYPGLLTIAGNDAVDVVVATQTIEVGIDVDFAGLVTDVAPLSALVQRAGRVNRLGEREHGPVVVVVPARPIDEAATQRYDPYAGEDLRAAQHWVESLVADGRDLAPWRLLQRPGEMIPERARRDLWQRLSRNDLRALSRTSDPGHADLDLTLWLDDDLPVNTFADASIGVVLRHLRLPAHRGMASPDEVVALLRATPPQDREVMGLRRAVAQELVGAYVAAARQRHTYAPVFRYRPGADADDRVISLPVVPEGPTAERGVPTMRGVGDGDVLVLDADLVMVAGLAPWSTRALGATPGDGGEPAVGDAYEDPGQLAELAVDADDSRDPADDQRLHGLLNLRIGDLSSLSGHAAMAAIAAYRGDGDITTEDTTVAERRGALVDELDDLASRGSATREWAAWIRAVRDLVAGPVWKAQIHVSDPDDDLQYLVIRDDRRPLRGDRLSTGERGEPVLLPIHHQAVADRAAQSAASLGLGADLVQALRLAGLHHDDGKSDLRFQRHVLGAAPGSPMLAKSGDRWRRTKPRPSGDALPPLPTSWRHEQRSVLHAAASADLAADRHDGELDAELVLRLVGTSHGWGRPSFPHATVDLLPVEEVDERALDLFDDGGWEALIERTDHRYGVWTTAYLEAVLRAADWRVSREGS